MGQEFQKSIWLMADKPLGEKNNKNKILKKYRLESVKKGLAIKGMEIYLSFSEIFYWSIIDLQCCVSFRHTAR